MPSAPGIEHIFIHAIRNVADMTNKVYTGKVPIQNHITAMLKINSICDSHAARPTN